MTRHDRDANGLPPQRGISRRTILKGGAALSLALAMPACGRNPSTAIGGLPASVSDRIETVPGLVHDVVLRWGDALFADAPSLNMRAVRDGSLSDLDPEFAAGQFGYNCDAIHFFPLEDVPDRGIICVNHEYTCEELFLPGLGVFERLLPGAMARYVRRHPQVARLTQLMHGISVAVIVRGPQGRWEHEVGSPYARRITGVTPCELTGPARGHALLRTAADGTGTRVLGTLSNCAGGQTPWGTFLSAEENVDDYFGNPDGKPFEDGALREAHRRMPPRSTSKHGWEFVEARFDVGQAPTELLRFGWIVEVDPYDPLSIPKKRTALGRFKHENATTVPTRDGRIAVYMGDDEKFEYVYKFVSAERLDPEDRAANRNLLDHGTLHVARFDADGSGCWLALSHGEGPLTAANGFESAADVVIRARAAADLLGATPMDRPEDIAVDPATGRVYVALTKNPERKAVSRREVHAGRDLDAGPDAANPRGPNTYGHVIEVLEEGGDTAASRFRWGIFVSGGEAAAEAGLGGPDNLALGHGGNLWIVTDGTQPDGSNNGCFRVPTSGPERGQVRRVMSAPRGAEVCGCEFTPDGTTLLLSIQHPGKGGSLDAPVSDWPDGLGHVSRPAVIALRREDGGIL